MPHAHHHTKTGISEKNLLVAVILNFTITLIEIIGGLISNSLALLSDAIHNLGDSIAVLVAYLAHRISKKKSNIRKTFGYKRVEILTSFLNSVMLVAICIFLIFEAINRFRNPTPIKGLIMFFVATIGLLANFISVLLLRSDSIKNINVRAAYLHLLGDTFSSVAVISGGILIYFFNIYWMDPLITILISFYILKETYLLIKDSTNILMQSTPKNLDLSEVKREIEKLPEVNNIHHIHAWNLTEQEIHFEGHVDLVHDLPVSQTDVLRKKIEDLLHNRYDISHVTIQMEYGYCDDTRMIHHK